MKDASRVDRNPRSSVGLSPSRKPLRHGLRQARIRPGWTGPPRGAPTSQRGGLRRAPWARGICMKRLVASLVLILVLSNPSTAVTLKEVEATCPLNGKTFTARAYASYYLSGWRFYGMLIIAGSPQLPPVPVCQESGFPVYKEQFALAELDQIRHIVETKEFEHVRSSNTDRNHVRSPSARQTVLVVPETLIRATRVQVGKGGATTADLEQLILESGYGSAPVLPFQLFSQLRNYGLGDRRSHPPGQRARQSIRLRVFDAQCDASAIQYLCIESA